MAVLMALVVGVGLPLAYFMLSYSHQDAALRTEAEINARLVTKLINENPELWRYEELRLLDLIHRRPGSGAAEVRRIVDLDRSVIAESAEPLGWPVQTRAGLLKDAGRTVGAIEISRSLRPLLLRTALLALAGLLLGFIAFRTLRTAPLRMLRQALLALSEEKERALVTLRSIGDGVITTDARGRVMMMNSVAEDLTGWSHEEAQGRPLHEIFHIVQEKTRAACESPVDRVLREERTIELANHTLLIARDGSERAIADSGAPIRGQDGNIIGVVLVFRDVTEKQQHEAEMQKAAKLDSLGVLAGGIAHDFNNILTSIMGNISLALLEGPQGGTAQAGNDYLARADSACQRAQDLTRQLLTFSRGGTPVKETLSLAELVRASSDFALTGSGIRPAIHIAEDLPPVDADAGQINQVLHNLLINAVEAMPNGGMVTIHVDRVQMQSGKDRLPLAAGEYVLISVLDQGIGIPKQHVARIFDPYFTTKKKGSGLGLATCYSIIRSHDGHIAVDSEMGKGSLFRVYLPTSTSTLPERQKAQEGIIRGAGAVLVMDDEEAIRTLARQMLARLGYEATLASDGAEAVECYRKAAAAGRPFDAVILDLTIPGGMGGREAMEKLLEIDAAVKAIVSSGYSESPVMSDFKRYGFSGVLRKPYDAKLMSQVLHTVVRSGQTSS
jgi:PAS domain S-box-containing protein